MSRLRQSRSRSAHDSVDSRRPSASAISSLVPTSRTPSRTSTHKRYFGFDGKRRDGLPHIKVRDAASPNEVGRIYFAFDPARKRLIVNHVGLHL